MTEKGYFMVLEGLDGSGTTTQSIRLAEYLFKRDKKNVIVLTREPTTLSPYGIELRRRLKGDLLPGENVIHDPAYWADLFINDRRWHLEHIVIPAVLRGEQVISDRHKLSTIAYQSAQGADMEELIRRHEDFYRPDITLLLDLSAETAMSRVENTRDVTEYFERLDLQRRVQQNYLLAEQKLRSTENIVVLEGTPPLDEVTLAIQHHIDLLYTKIKQPHAK